MNVAMSGLYVAMSVLSVALSVVIVVVWIGRRRRARKSVETRPLEPYTPAQRMGIIGIVMFLLPVFVIVLLNLWKPLLIALTWVFDHVDLPPVVEAIVRAVVACCILTSSWMGTYLLCEYIWPQRRPRNEGRPGLPDG